MADGVGGWANKGMDSGVLSHRLLFHMDEIATAESTRSGRLATDLVSLLVAAYETTFREGELYAVSSEL